jgi:hypothetical protein
MTQTTKHLLRKAAGLMGKEELADRKLLKLANVLDAWVGSQTKQQ